MKVGDIVINPWVSPLYKGQPNPLYQSMVIDIGKSYTKCLRIDGLISEYYTSDVRQWDKAGTVDLERLILGVVYVRGDAKVQNYPGQSQY